MNCRPPKRRIVMVSSPPSSRTICSAARRKAADVSSGASTRQMRPHASTQSEPSRLITISETDSPATDQCKSHVSGIGPALGPLTPYHPRNLLVWKSLIYLRMRIPLSYCFPED